MKKTFITIFALVMALTMVIGTTSMVYAAKPLDFGFKCLSTQSEVQDTDGNIWVLYSTDYNDYFYDPVAETGNLTVIENNTLYDFAFTGEDFRPSINWKKGVAGVATFKNSLMNLTISGTDPLGVTENIVSGDIISLSYLGPATVKGTVTLYGIIYAIDWSTDSIYYEEYTHIVR